MKKSISLVLAVVMVMAVVLSAIPFSAFAATDVAKVGDKTFTTLENAIVIANASKEDVTIELLADVTVAAVTFENALGKTITVEGNKVTLDMSAGNPAFRKVVMYMYQDADDSQLHMYMHTDAFINYFANLQIFDLISDGKIDLTDATAVEKVFADMEARVESINVSFVMKARN